VKDENGGNVPYVPVNYDRLFHGPVSVRTALANSYNIPAVKTLDRIGVNTLQQLATAAGISTFTGEAGLALTLGGSEVKLLDLTAAYGVLDDGKRLNPRAILDFGFGILDSSSSAPTIQNPKSKIQNVISPATAYLITDILSDNVARIPAFGEGSVLELPFPAAVKTGTTTDWRDNWTIGYSTERVVGVWVGNADNTPMLDVSGIDGAGPIWRDLMLAAHAHAPAVFPRPAGIEEVTICAPSGLLPTQYCPRTRRERFLAGSAPTEPDNQFQPRRIDLATQRTATADTPPEQISERVYWVLPPEYHDWMVSQGIPIDDHEVGAKRHCRFWIDDCSAAVPSTSATNHGQSSIVNRQSSIVNRQSSIVNRQLILQEPTSHTAYQIHPGLPRANQRIAISGYTADGTPWAALRLIKDGTVLAETQHATRIQRWWVLEPGQHQFGLEGKPTADADWVRSDQAFVVVENFVDAQASTSN